MQLCHQGDKHASELADAKAECEPSVEPSVGKQYPFPASEQLTYASGQANTLACAFSTQSMFTGLLQQQGISC